MYNKIQILLTFFLVFTNLLVSSIVQNLNLWHVSNYAQELFRFGWVSFVLIILLGFVLVLKLKLINKYTFIISIIQAGLISNILERLYFGYVVDYFNFGVGIVNLADLQIYIGCFYIVFKELLANQKFSQA